MALTPINYINGEGLKNATAKIVEWANSEKSLAIKTVLTKDNSILFFKKPNALDTDTPEFTINFPVEYFLDQAKTIFVNTFAWSEETYPNSTDPTLDGQPVLVLALKGDDNTVTYSFVSLLSLVNIYTASTNVSTVTITIDNSTNTIAASVNISKDANNLLKVGSDGGLYAEATDDTTKADKITQDNIRVNQILVDDGSGNLAASGITIEDINTSMMVPYTEEEINEILKDII